MHAFDLTRQDWEAWLSHHAFKPLHAKAILQALYKEGLTDPNLFPHLGEALKTKLQTFSFSLPQLRRDAVSEDGTEKWSVTLSDGLIVELVCIAHDGRTTICLSSQAGCALNCQFCVTAKQGLQRNLHTHEVIGQLIALQKHYPANPCSNVVFMGMGEPLMNESAVHKAIQLLTDDYAYALSSKRVTVSTVGIAPAITRLVTQPCALTVSLHSADEVLRQKLMPITQTFSLDQLKKACLHYTQHKPLTIAYVLLQGINDSDEAIEQCCQWIGDMPCKINLIQFNPAPGIPFHPTDPDRIYTIQKRFKAYGLTCTVRYSKGRDAMAACGQLSSQVTHEMRQRSKSIPSSY